jgi:AcrR family transcriptional regulator
VPRDSTDTKARLLREAGRLFARHGLHQVTVQEITQAAGQRNVSALSYHFGSREGVVEAILDRYAAPTDAARGARLELAGPDAATADLAAALVLPYAAHLGTEDGRDYLRIVAQMAGRFSRWRDPNPGTGPCLVAILDALEARPPELPVAIRRERLVAMILLLTVTLAERARAVDSAAVLELDEATFLANLIDVLVAVIEAPRRPPPVSASGGADRGSRPRPR